jgi:hypothetical protein
MLCAQNSYADAGEQGSKPLACAAYGAPKTSAVLGSWTLRQRDDSADWQGPWTIDFKADGTWTQSDKFAGYWCQSGDTLIFGFASTPRTTYRGTLGAKSIQGIESWEGGGTGIFEATR